MNHRSHGKLNGTTNQDEIMDVNWQGIPTIELIDMFALGTSCPSMIGKPKIFIIQVPKAFENITLLIYLKEG